MLGMEIDNRKPGFWEELSCGVCSLMIDASKLDGGLVGEARKHKWTNFMLTELINWDRASVEPEPKMEEHNLHLAPSDTGSLAAQNVLLALRKSLMLRTSLHAIFPGFRHDDSEDELVPVAILFSGGLDSMILAALLDECLDPRYGIDLLNVSFDGQSAPDRISARAGVEELRRIAPFRRWKLVEIDAELSNLTLELKHVMSLIKPANTYMDLNIGIALWLAARGNGWVNKGSSSRNDDNQQSFMYNSKARIVLVGSGADEQCAGYGRHRTKYRCGSWLGLHEEMKLDMQRIWKRNMGRDDRCIADNGREARFPFLDEDVVRILLDIPLWEVANLDQPSGTGDKKILREVARMLGLREAAIQPKRAIQVSVTMSYRSILELGV
uniref:Asparagine synthetase domain-containing protein n=1 Tax=Rhizophora mucronata TaxID=61149 RepID=A0A2P2KXA0_RHIMU